MEKIKVGEYVRDNEGNIDKIINTLSLFKDVYLYLGEEGYQYSENAISKHSKNIIDLIEEGDYVNGKLIHNKFGNPKNGELMIIYGNGKHFDNKNIKTVVTKEQFANAEYRLEE